VQDADPHDLVKAWKLYQQHIAADPSREVALLYNHALDQWAVVQGGPGSVPTPEGMRRLGWEVRDTTLGRHSHPVGPGGVTSTPNLLPSGRRGDLQLVRGEAARGEPSAAAHMSAIDVMIDRGSGPVPDRTFLFYDRQIEMWIVDYPVSGAGAGRARVSFVSMEQYRMWFEGQFHFSPDIPEDVGPAGPRAPGGEKPGAPGEGTAEPAGTEQSQARTAPTEDLARVNVEVKRLTGGVGLKPIPSTPATLEESNRKVEAARAVLARADATPEDIRGAALDIAERAVADFRARMLTFADSPGVLTAKELQGMCGGARDISADSILSRIGNSPHPITIERIQAAHLGITRTNEFGETSAQRHGLLIMTLPDGTRILVDPTAAQFTSRSRATFSAEHMLSTVEGASLAATLLRDGVVVLTPETAPKISRQYVMLLGADPGTAEGFAARLLAGDATILTETIVNGQISRESAHPVEVMQHVHGADPEAPSVAESMKEVVKTVPANHPFRPILEELAEALQVLNKPPIKESGKK
jgi:hypothetical protein